MKALLLWSALLASAFVLLARESEPVGVSAASLPKVVLNAESIAPRAIEQRTGEMVTHNYAQAWQDLANCVEANRTDLLNDFFTGEAKTRLTHLVVDQRKSGLRTHYEDHGHQVKAVFYSPDGGEMQLQDTAQLEMQVFDGQKMIYSSTSPRKYLVLMTPGADRWYVRTLESVGNDAF
jgi:uncharacterized protein YkuJ